MDTISSLALAVDIPLIKEVGVLLGNSFIYAGIVVLMMILAEKRDGKRLKILLSLILTFIAVSAIKSAIALERPCAGEDWCPWGYSFPSAHAAVAFALMIAFVDKKSYPLFLLFALFVSFSRLNLGVHVFHDIAGALPIAIISYYVTDILWKRYGPKEMEGGR